VSRSLIRLSWPVAVERLALALLIAVDSILVGRYVGDDGLAAVGLAGILLWLPQAASLGIASATTTVVGWDVGARSPRRLQETVQAAIALTATWGVFATIVVVLLARPALTIIGLEGGALEAGVDYLPAAALSLLGFAVLEGTAGALRGAGDTRTPMLIVLFINIFNAAITFALISGVFGLEMGTRGAGIGSASAALLGGAIALVVLARGRAGLRWQVKRAAVISRAALKRIGGLAIPITLGDMQFMVAFLFYTRIIASLGTESIAAHTVAIRTIDLGVMPGIALGTAVNALIGQTLGAGRPDLAEEVAKRGLQLGVALMLVTGVATVIFAPHLSSLYTDSADVREDATDALRVFALGLPALGIIASHSGVLRGAGDVRWVLIMTTVTVWGIRIPTALFGVNVLDWGLAGAWWGATLELNVGALLILYRVRQKAWLRRSV